MFIVAFQRLSVENNRNFLRKWNLDSQGGMSLDLDYLIFVKLAKIEKIRQILEKNYRLWGRKKYR